MATISKEECKRVPDALLSLSLWSASMAIVPFKPNCGDLDVRVCGNDIVVSMCGTHRTPLSVGYRKLTGAQSLTRTYSWLPLFPTPAERTFERRAYILAVLTAGKLDGVSICDSVNVRGLDRRGW